MREQGKMREQYLNDGVANLKNMYSRHQVSHRSQLGCMAELDPGANFVNAYRVPQEEPLQTRSVHHGDVMDNGHAQLHTPQAAADDAEVHILLAQVDHKGLEDGAPGEEEVEVPVLHGDAAEAELNQVGERRAARESRGVREPPSPEVETLDGGEAEDRGGEGKVERPGAVNEDELLDALDGEEVEPERELGSVRAHGAAGEVDAAEGAPVGLQDAGHRGGDGAGAGACAQR